MTGSSSEPWKTRTAYPSFVDSQVIESLMEQPTFDQATRKKRQIGKRNFKEKERSDKKKRGKRSKGRKEGKKERIRIAREERASISKGFRCKHLKEIQASL